jgi:transcriptional regulator with XRE-family HTH domain
MDARAILGWNLRRLRVAKGLSQERLALAAGIDRAYVGRVERGEENVTLNVIAAVAEALEVAVTDLFAVPPDGAALPQPLPPGRRPKSERA